MPNTGVATGGAPAARSYGEDRLFIDQVTMLCRFASIPLIGTLFIGGVLSWLMLDDYPMRAVAAWYVTLVAMSYVRASAGRSFLARRQRTAKEAQRCCRVMLTEAAASG